MTPKQKAIELYNKFYISKISTNSFRKEESKNCALICADEIIELRKKDQSNYEYWISVKQEINKL